jgi:hypothetical protein
LINTGAIRKQAEKWWPEVLRTALRQEDYFPQALRRIGKVKPTERLREFERIRQQQDELIAGSKQQLGHGYTLYWLERSYRNVGNNRFIDAITFDTLGDYLAFLRRTSVYDRFLADADLIRTSIPPLTEWCGEHPLAIEKYHGEWPALLRLVEYFQNQHQMDRYYIRELPVSVPTKFVENHKKILHRLLDAVLPSEQVRVDFHPSKEFEQRYGLRYRQPMVRLRLLDRTLAQQHFSGLDDFRIPLSDFENLRLPLQRLIILENKTNYNNLMNFLTLPAMRATGGLFGSGFRVGLLKSVPWLHDIKLYYWGDIDAHGLQILAQLRGYFPHVQPFLMDRATFDAYPEYHTTAPLSTVSELQHLTPTESDLFQYLNTHQLRLEQERIPLERVQEVMRFLLPLE